MNRHRDVHRARRPMRRRPGVTAVCHAAILLLAAAAAPAATDTGRECVLLLHGLARTEHSMAPLAERLAAEYRVVNLAYPSREAPIERLSATVGRGLAACRVSGAARTHVVTHSLGGILLRHYLEHRTVPDLGRTVMLGPPNQGSEIVDALRHLALFEWVNGPAGHQLGTGPDSVPRALGPVDFELGVIAGTRSLEPWVSHHLPGPNDGKVAVAATRVEGMADFVRLPVTHTFMMRDERVHAQVLHFLRHGRFDHAHVPGER